jgi:CRP/FNR family transcriptional regulator, cyclic AMP receptor protein
MRSPGSWAAAINEAPSVGRRAPELAKRPSSRTSGLGVIVITFERLSDETVGSPAREREAAKRAASLRTRSLYRQDRSEQPSQGLAALHADRGSRLHRSSTSLFDATTELDGSSKPVRSGTIALADLYPDLATGLGAAGLQALRNALLLPVVRVQHGPCEVMACADAAEAHGLLGAVVTDGLLIGEMRLAGHVSAQIYGPGDLLGGDHEPDGSLATVQALHAPVPTSLAVLDDRFVTAMRRWPRLAAQFMTQAMRQVDHAGQHKAISQLTRVEDRLLALFWYLADRWGRVRVDGIMLDLPLTHEAIGWLIGARRPTVSLGLRELATQDLLRREPDGRWLLAAESLQRVTSQHRDDGRYRSSVGVGG